MTGLKFMGAGVAAGLVGVGIEASIWFLHEDRTGLGALRFNEQVERRRTAEYIFLGIGGLSLLAGATLFLWPTSHEAVVTISPNGLVTVSGRM